MEQTLLPFYEVGMCIDVLMSTGMDTEDAWDFFSFNVAGSYVEKKPCFIDLYDSQPD